jgi:hypothetical protein
MSINPEIVKELAEEQGGIPIFKKNGEHKQYTYRYEFSDKLNSSAIRHIAINRKPKNNIIVYVNKFSINGSEYPTSGFNSIGKPDYYYKGFTGKNGNPGIAESVASVCHRIIKYLHKYEFLFCLIYPKS